MYVSAEQKSQRKVYDAEDKCEKILIIDRHFRAVDCSDGREEDDTISL